MGVLLFLANVWRSRRHGRRAGDNPWEAGTLEGATSSPPASYNFLRPLVVTGREPLWELRNESLVVTGLHTNVREVLVTSVLDAEPDHRLKFPDPSFWPFLAAVATTGLFIGSIFTPWAVPIGAIPATITFGSFGGELRGITQFIGHVVCIGCSLQEVRKAQPHLINLYQLSQANSQQGQVVMQGETFSDPHERMRWKSIVGLSHLLQMRATEQVFKKLTAEENLFKKLAVTGLLRGTSVLDIGSVEVNG